MHKHDWFLPDSNLSKFLAEQDCKQVITDPLNMYMWSTKIDGVKGDDDEWDAAGRALAHYIVPPLAKESLLKPKDTFLIAHSHGGNVVAYACGKYGLKVSGLVTVGTPVRKELFPIYAAASDNIERHLHLYASWRDYMQILGSLFDGRFGIHREQPYAEKNAKVEGGDHGSILRDTKMFHLWLDKGWLKYWKGEAKDIL